MSCHKVSRALLDRLRFGELDADCDVYLEHVERCRECQQDVAVDRALVRDLRLALKARVEGFEPSPAVWRAVRLQAQDPEPHGSWSRLTLSLGRAMRVMVPVGAVMLAAVLAWSGPQVGGSNVATLPSPLASRMQWHEQLLTTAEVEQAKLSMLRFNPTPGYRQPHPSGVMPFPEPVAAIKMFTKLPAGGVIR